MDIFDFIARMFTGLVVLSAFTAIVVFVMAFLKVALFLAFLLTVIIAIVSLMIGTILDS